MRHPLLTLLFVVVSITAGSAQDRVVPFPSATNLTGPEIKEAERLFEELEAEQARLNVALEEARQSGADVEAVARELELVKARITDVFMLPPDQLAAYQDAARFLQPKLGELVPDRWGERAIRAEDARALVDLLYVDWNDGKVNRRLQDQVLAGVLRASQHPALSPDACRVLRDGVLEYYEGVRTYYPDGRLVSPGWMVDLCEVVCRVSEFDDAVAYATGSELMVRGCDWLRALERPIEARETEERLRSFFEVTRQILDDNPDFSSADAHRRADADSAYGSAARLSRHDAIRRVHYLLRRFTWDVEKVKEITRLCLADYGDDRANTRMRGVLYTAYIRILTRDADEFGTEPNARRVYSHIDANLLSLARGGRVAAGREMGRWCRSVQALGARTSPEMRAFVRKHAKEKDSTALHTACARIYAAQADAEPRRSVGKNSR